LITETWIDAELPTAVIASRPLAPKALLSFSPSYTQACHTQAPLISRFEDIPKGCRTDEAQFLSSKIDHRRRE
jgi:hypothetical protein